MSKPAREGQGRHHGHRLLPSTILAVVAFIWMHLHMFPPETLGGLLHSLFCVDLFFLVLLFAITMYLRQVMNRNTRTILRALANTRQR
jgi:hypothetical protein